jgi:phage shock protein E
MSTIKSLVTENNATIVDVRGPWEFEDGHIEGALNIPLDEIPSRMDEVKSLKLPIIVYCRSGNRSGIAELIMKQAGITEVYNGGGLADMQIALM